MSCENNEPPSLLPKNFSEVIHGEKIADPYRYVEDIQSEEVSQWIEKINNHSLNTLNSLSNRDKLINTQLSYEKEQTHKISKLRILEKGMYFYLKKLPEEKLAKLYYRNSFESEEFFLYDPNTFGTDKEKEFIINYIKPDWEGSKVVVSLTEKGKEISNMIILDVTSKHPLPYIIDNCWPSATGGIHWSSDNSGFYYVHLPTIDPSSKEFLLNTKTVLYEIGKNPKKLNVIFSKKTNPDLNMTEEDIPVISKPNEKNNFLIGKIGGVDNYWDSYIIEKQNVKKGNWKPFYKKEHKISSYEIFGDTIVFISAKNASNFKLCKTSLQNPNFDEAEVLVPEREKEVIKELAVTSQGIYFVTTENGVKSSLFQINKKNQIKEIKLPKVFGSIRLRSRGYNYPDLWISASGWTTNQIRYHYTNGQLQKQNLNKDNLKEITDNLVIRELEVPSHDGNKIPLSVIYHKNFEPSSQSSMLIEGYGSYGISFSPSFSLDKLIWLQEGGIYAVAHVRGGGEKGDSWHKAGYKETKENTWKDLISCTEYLINHKFTSKGKIAIESASAGGILIGRAITERPDLFAAAVIRAGAMNMLRSEFQPNGPNNTKEFGSIKDSLEFKSLYKMDSYHHIKKGESYPATISIVGLNDPRVVAWDPIKFVARLQNSNSSKKPTLLLADSNSGHGFDETRMKRIEKNANILAFALWQTGHPDYQPE